MKAKAIEKLLKGVYNTLIESIKDEKVSKIVSNNSYITGGCIPSMLMDEFVNDYDIYFRSKADVEIVKEYYLKIDVGEIDSQKKNIFLPKLITDNAINLTDKIQLILKFYGEPENVVKHFDWQHIKSYFDLEGGLHLTDDVYKLIVEKELVYTGSKYPLSSLLRLRKFLKKGWYVSTKTMVHIILDVISAFTITDMVNKVNNEEIDETPFQEKEFNYENNNYQVDVDTLIHQLNGVDPLTIQSELEKHTSKRLTLQEVIKLL